MRWGWAVVALAVTALLLASLAFETGSCASGAGESCRSAPLGGWGAAWARVVVGAAVVAYATWRAFRRER